MKFSIFRFSSFYFKVQENALCPKFILREKTILSESKLHKGKFLVLFGSLKPQTYSTDSGSTTSTNKSSLKQHSRWTLRLPLRWVFLPIGLGIAATVFSKYRSRKRNIDGYPLAKDWEITCYRMIPLKTLSRLWGWVNELELPVWARKPVLSLYARSFGCNLEEAEIEDLRHYRNLGEFFRRSIKLTARPVTEGDYVVSPADGKVLHSGEVEKSRLEQVKGIAYSLQGFFGPSSWTKFLTRNSTYEDNVDAGVSYQDALMSNPVTNCLYHCVIYLAPGDYHRFHSPVEWEVMFRRHFSGELFSVNPGVARWIAGLFSLNERAVYMGKWKYGFFSMAAVGATNVGSIKVQFDKDLATNVIGWKKGTYHDHSFVSPGTENGITVSKGDLFGEFNLGSTIVMIFEAPKDFQFQLEEGQKIKFGESLNSLPCLLKENEISAKL